MVNELLEYARGSNADIGTLVRTNYAEFVSQLLEDVRQEFSARGVTLMIDGDLPDVTVQIHPTRLSRVFHNLFGNAADAMHNSGKITVRVRANKNGEVITEVQDTGKGIPPEIGDQIFKPFVTFGKANGTGLGLTISKKTIEDLGGKMSVRNSPQGGAVFSFTLPIQPD
jgi:signal transduction histidine kinase